MAFISGMTTAIPCGVHKTTVTYIDLSSSNFVGAMKPFTAIGALLFSSAL